MSEVLEREIAVALASLTSAFPGGFVEPEQRAGSLAAVIEALDERAARTFEALGDPQCLGMSERQLRYLRYSQHVSVPWRHRVPLLGSEVMPEVAALFPETLRWIADQGGARLREATLWSVGSGARIAPHRGARVFHRESFAVLLPRAEPSLRLHVGAEPSPLPHVATVAPRSAWLEVLAEARFRYWICGAAQSL